MGRGDGSRHFGRDDGDGFPTSPQTKTARRGGGPFWFGSRAPVYSGAVLSSALSSSGCFAAVRIASAHSMLTTAANTT